jgi:hypothetical protein
MAWISLNKDQLKTRLAKEELDQIITVGGQGWDGQDIVADLLAQITNHIRGKVASHSPNIQKLGPDGTIPQECEFTAYTIVRQSLIGSLPLSELATELRKDELRQAHTFLDQIADGKVRIESANGELTESSSPSVSYSGNKWMEF